MPGQLPDDVIGGQLDAGDHVCAFYRSPAERDLLLVPFLAAGLVAGSRCTCVVDSTPPAAVLDLLSVHVDVDRHLDEGRLEVLGSDETYFARGGFLPEEMLRFWESKAGSAGSGVVRNIGDMSWAHRDKPGVEKIALYESALNRVMGNVPQVNVCLYDLTRCDGRLVMDVLKTHPKAMIGAMVVDNPYYLRPDEFLADAGGADAGGEGS
ncbi:MAG: MEDS domain-containing protein [Actinobacteria bacterium]|nr:MEDS domain-containing protein [Actinomycetota bacterium]